jgi:7-cyano-7-deazaguanine reductase
MYGDTEIEMTANRPLETWPNLHPDNDYLIQLEHPEFTALCPRSGYPDFGTIVVEYYPGPLVLELKAFKLYINSFRNERISHEAVVNTIADRLAQELSPKMMRVIGDFQRRGNVKTVITTYRGSGELLPNGEQKQFVFTDYIPTP